MKYRFSHKSSESNHNYQDLISTYLKYILPCKIFQGSTTLASLYVCLCVWGRLVRKYDRVSRPVDKIRILHICICFFKICPSALNLLIPNPCSSVFYHIQPIDDDWGFVLTKVRQKCDRSVSRVIIKCVDVTSEQTNARANNH